MKWVSGISGYVEISLQGVQPEKIINMALSRGISIWDIRQDGRDCYRLKVSLGGYKALRVLTRRSACRVKFLQKRGVPFFLMKAKRRKVLVFGTFFFWLALYFFASFVWVVEVTGNETVPTELILVKSAELGLKKGAPKAAFNRNDLAAKLLLEIPELSWAGIHAQGTKIVIEVAEKTLPPQNGENVAADLVARIDGIIEEILTLKGTPLVREGDVVKKGQVLIAGFVYPQIIVSEQGLISPGGEPEAVRAKGVIRARVVRTCAMQCPIREEIQKDSGAESSTVVLRLFGKEVYLRGAKESPYLHYRSIRRTKRLLTFQSRIFRTNVELITTIYKEQEYTLRPWGIEGAYREAARRAYALLERELPQDCKITAQKTEPIVVRNKEIVALKYLLETVENIAVYPPEIRTPSRKMAKDAVIGR